MNDDYKIFCMHCTWNNVDYGCICPSYAEVYQCNMYMFYHPDEVKKFNDDMKKWIIEKAARCRSHE